jgi:RNA-directed DNA polymerase
MKMIAKVLNKRNLQRAYRQVLLNKGSAGIDGMTVEGLHTHLKEHWKAINLSVVKEQYLPSAIKGVEIPKGNGKTRLLGVPTVLDRFLQQAVFQTMMPHFEAEFKEYSYGFRPKRNAHQAVNQSQLYINEGYQHIVDIDLKNFFDEVEHCRLLQLIYRKVKCPTTLRLIRKWLKSPIEIKGKLTKRTKGIPQGSPLSPLLSNIMLHELDKELEKKGLRYVRYADDFSVYTKSKQEAKRVGNEIYLFLKDKLNLPINREKSGIRRPLTFEILGYKFVSVYEKGVKGKYQLTVSDKSWEKLKQKLKEVTRKTAPKSFERRMQELKSVQRGWLNYFKLGNIWGKLRTLDGWIRNRLRYCIWHDWKKPERKRKKLIQLGVEQGLAYAWSRSRMGGWAIAQSPMLGTTITLARLHKRGYESMLTYYEKITHA